MLPSLAPSTDHTSGVVNPSFWVQVGIEKSRKRSRPLRVATQILPSRSSKRSQTESPERPSPSANRFVRPPCTCARPRSTVATHSPPSRSRSSRRTKSSGTPSCRDDGSSRPSTKRAILLPERSEASRLRLHLELERRLARLEANRIQGRPASISRVRSVLPPRDCLSGPHRSRQGRRRRRVLAGGATARIAQSLPVGIPNEPAQTVRSRSSEEQTW